MEAFDEAEKKRLAEKQSSLLKKRKRMNFEESKGPVGDKEIPKSSLAMNLPMKRQKVAGDISIAPEVQNSKVYNSLFDKPRVADNNDGSKGHYEGDFMTRSAKFGLQ